MELTHCPNCNISWKEEETIYEFFLNKYNDKVQANNAAEMYGCTKETPRHFGKNVVGIQDGSYDGISYWKCESCLTTFDRFTMKEI